MKNKEGKKERSNEGRRKRNKNKIKYTATKALFGPRHEVSLRSSIPASQVRSRGLNGRRETEIALER